MLNRHKIPDVVLGALLAVAIFALGSAFESSCQPPTNEQAASDTKRGGGIVAPEQSGNKLTDWLLVLFSGLLFGSTALLWNANNRSAKIAERALTELEAPFLTIKINNPGIEIKDNSIAFGVLQCSIINYGRSPASVLEFSADTPLLNMDAGKFAAPVDPQKTRGSLMPYGVIAPPNVIFRGDFRETPPPPPSKTIAFFIGFVKYSDLLQNRFVLGFCFVFHRKAANGF